MKSMVIYHKNYETILHQGTFPSYRAAVEDAAARGLCLHGADLRHCNLSNIMLDGADLTGADFSHANLSGANMSEIRAEGANFTGASLYNTCFAYSNMRRCVFDHAFFGATNITGVMLYGSSFSTQSCFSLDFDQADSMENCVFKNPNGVISRMSHPPLVIRGHGTNMIVMMDDHIKIGALIVPYVQRDRVLKY